MDRYISQENDIQKERAKKLRAIIRKYKDGIAGGKVQNVENVKGHKGQKKKYVRSKIHPDIRKIKGSNSKTLSQEEQRHLSDLLDFAQKQERNASPLIFTATCSQWRLGNPAWTA